MSLLQPLQNIKENIENYVDELKIVDKWLTKWTSLDDYYSALRSRMETNREFYLAVSPDGNQWSTNPEGELKLTLPLASAIADEFAFLLPAAEIKTIPNGTDEVAKAVADHAEKLINRTLTNTEYKLKYRYGKKGFVILGFAYLQLAYDGAKKQAGSNGGVEILFPNPFTVRVEYASNQYDKLKSFMKYVRMDVDEIKRIWGVDVAPDSENQSLPQSLRDPSDQNMATILYCYSDKEFVIIAGNRILNYDPSKENKGIKNEWGFIPARQVNAVISINDPHGRSPIERIIPLQREINSLISLAGEIARDLGYPTLLEYDQSLGGQKISKWRGQKVQVKSPRNGGKSIEYLYNTAQIQGILKQIEMLIQLMHRIVLMPEAAMGDYQPGINSGFQQKLVMQPAIHQTDDWKDEWEAAMRWMARGILSMIEKKNPELLKVDDGAGGKYEIKNIEYHDMKVIWGEVLPIDDARLIQNLGQMIQLKLISLQTAMDQLNIPSPQDELTLVKQEQQDQVLKPEEAQKMMQLKMMMQQTMGQIQQITQQAQAQASQNMQGMMPQQPNPRNDLLGLDNPLPEEQKQVPDTSSLEAVAPTSTGGRPIRTAQVRR